VHKVSPWVRARYHIIGGLIAPSNATGAARGSRDGCSPGTRMVCARNPVGRAARPSTGKSPTRRPTAAQKTTLLIVRGHATRNYTRVQFPAHDDVTHRICHRIHKILIKRQKLQKLRTLHLALKKLSRYNIFIYT
jgi:hypothetical protein